MTPDSCLKGGRLAAASISPAGRTFGSVRIAPDLEDANRCIAMMNSVTVRAPRCSVSARYQILPRTSFGSPARSNICFACSPPNTPSCAPDFSNNAAYCWTLSGVNGGTLIGFPLVCGCNGPGGGPWGGGGAAPAGKAPSNLGRGPGRNASSAVGSRPACA